MKTKLKISGIFVVFIAMLLLMGAVSASDESISNHTISEVETTELNADESVLSLESVDDNIIKEKESTQDSTITQTNDNALGNSTGENTTTEGVITASDLKTEYHSGKTIKVTVTDKTTGKGIATTLKVQYVQNGKIAKEASYKTDSNGVAQITTALPVGKYVFKISHDDTKDNVTAATVSKVLSIVKTTTKVTAKKATGYKGNKITLKAVLSKTKDGKKVNEGKVKFKINGKTYTVKVKNGVATKKIKLTKVKTYKYTAQFLGNKNIKKCKVASGKAVVKNTYATKIVVNNIRGQSGDKVKYQIQVLTKSGKKVTSGQVKITWNGKSLVCNVTNGVVKLIGTLGGNFKKEVKGTQYFYKQFTTKFKAKYIPTSLKYKGSSAKYKMVSTYKCSVCGKTDSHTHIVNGTSTKIVVS
ncbi:Ig-like domain repeat protein [Methanobrevibacter sp. UBA212]|uniref:Ig-like domain repeat protein n=1 Tax=Methanobrevibacter sp. UBA212 TaxID=1915476 RepID=UPI0025F4F2D9|nr:Ig-like domain repeat protein [Methanobrevibacter sp. UBA212]